MRIPDDIRIVGFDNLSSSRMLPVPLTTISQPIDQMASEAVSLIADRLSNPQRPAREIMLTESLVVRQSSCAMQKPSDG
jgi:LacI family transcriptional regulator/LacI family purine nucleotide synthesis repressor